VKEIDRQKRKIQMLQAHLEKVQEHNKTLEQRLKANGLFTKHQILERQIQCKRFCGIYFLLKRHENFELEIVYVGKSKNIYLRIQEHMKGPEFDAWSWLDYIEDDLDFYERSYIERFDPIRNQTRSQTLGYYL